MRYLMNSSRRRGFLHQGGKPMSLSHLAKLGGVDTESAHSLVQELIDAGVCATSEDGTYFSPRIVAFESFRRKCSRAGTKGGGNPRLKREDDDEPLKVAPKDGLKDGPKDGAEDPPPEVSPPTTLSSLPPSSHTPRGREGPDHAGPASPVTEAHRRAAFDALNRWSNVSARKPIDEIHGDHGKVNAMLDHLATEPPIVQGKNLVHQHLLAAAAADHLRQKGKPFKSIAYAITCVKSELADWVTRGPPGADLKPANGHPAPRRPVVARDNDY